MSIIHTAWPLTRTHTVPAAVICEPSRWHFLTACVTALAREPNLAMTDVHEPAPPAGGGADHLAIPGDPRPWLVWAPPGPDGALSPQLARVVLYAYTATGAVVIDVDDDAAFAATAARTGRRHHALGGATHLATLGHAAGYIDLMLLRWPCDAIQPHWLFFACRMLLRSAGCLVVAVTGEPRQRIAQLSSLSGAASTAGLHIVDHVAVLTPDQGVATPTDRRPVPSGHDRSRTDQVAVDVAAAPPPTAHTDLMVLATKAAGDA